MKIKRIICFFFAVVFIVMALPLSVGAKTSMDATDVYSDLLGMNVDFSKYKKNTEDKIAKVLELLEYAYDANGNQNDYGLYVYVYNPSCEKINTNSQYNTIQLATETNSGTTAYKKYRLIFLSRNNGNGGSNDAENLFYKFKIDLPSSFASELNKVKRVYHVVDLELQYPNELNPRKTNMAMTFRYTGYQGYHGSSGAASSASTLYCARDNLETIEVNLKPATWKTISSDKGMNYRYEVSSVYFSIPDYYFEKYGNMADPEYKGLETVHGEWYEYRVNGLVTNNGSLFSMAEDVEGKQISLNKNYSLGNIMGTSVTSYVWYDDSVSFGIPVYGGGKTGYNYVISESSKTCGSKSIGMLMNSFYYSGIFESVSTSELQEEIFGVSNNGYSENGNQKQSYSKVDEGRMFGYNEYHISVGDRKLNDQISSYSKTHNKLWNYLIGNGYLYEDEIGYASIKPIKMLTDNDFNSFESYEKLGRKLFVSEGDAEDIKSYYEEATADGKTTYLMRFAVTDYYCEKVGAYDNSGQNIAGDHYYFEKTVFQNFDIFEFTFKNSEGKLTTVPVSSKPITITGTVDRPLGEGGILEDIKETADKFADLKPIIKWFILALGVILLFVILTFFTTPITTLFKIIVAPFKLIGKGIEKASEHKRYKKEEARKDAEERRKEAEEKRKEARETKERDKKRESENDRLRRLFNKQLKKEAAEREKNRKGEK
ncbi:MAG: hypothetical protein E7679_04830 [Ruminococcaceae bacterium]|nr:hypothetical protein [Oscillospiraceae bacterium]